MLAAVFPTPYHHKNTKIIKSPTNTTKSKRCSRSVTNEIDMCSFCLKATNM